jgi:hypothetical protein
MPVTPEAPGGRGPPHSETVLVEQGSSWRRRVDPSIIGTAGSCPRPSEPETRSGAIDMEEGKISAVQTSYDRIAEEYVVRISD